MDRIFFQLVDNINNLPFSDMLEVKVLSLAKGLCKLRVSVKDSSPKSFSEMDSWVLYVFCDLGANAASSTLEVHRRWMTPLISHVKILSLAGSKSFNIIAEAFERENDLVSSKVDINDDNGKTLATAMHIYELDKDVR
jgi:hypothetical protein